MRGDRERARGLRAVASALAALGMTGVPAVAQVAAPAPPPPAVEPPAAATLEEEDSDLFWSKEDGMFDVSGFLDEQYGFLPIVLPITEPAVGYGAAGALAFISQPLGAAKEGLGRPNITAVGGFGTENGSWGALAADVRYWLDDRLQTVAAVVRSDINLEFHGIGEDEALDHDPLGYTLAPVGGFLQTKYRLGESHFWAGLSYALARTTVSFDDPTGTPGIPDFERHTDVGGLTPSLTYDTRDNVFTTLRGSYVELGVGLFAAALGGDDEFQRARLTAMHFMPLGHDLFLGLRADAAATWGDVPFYLRPYVALRGVEVMRYQGAELAQAEAELRWKCWERFSVVGFGGYGVTWRDAARFDDVQTVISGGTGFRYELARDYGLHAGLDVAVSRDTAAVYVQIGGAWIRP